MQECRDIASRRMKGRSRGARVHDRAKIHRPGGCKIPLNTVPMSGTASKMRHPTPGKNLTSSSVSESESSRYLCVTDKLSSRMPLPSLWHLEVRTTSLPSLSAWYPPLSTPHCLVSFLITSSSSSMAPQNPDIFARGFQTSPTGLCDPGLAFSTTSLGQQENDMGTGGGL